MSGYCTQLSRQLCSLAGFCLLQSRVPSGGGGVDALRGPAKVHPVGSSLTAVRAPGQLRAACQQSLADCVTAQTFCLQARKEENSNARDLQCFSGAALNAFHASLLFHAFPHSFSFPLPRPSPPPPPTLPHLVSFR